MARRLTKKWLMRGRKKKASKRSTRSFSKKGTRKFKRKGTHKKRRYVKRRKTSGGRASIAHLYKAAAPQIVLDANPSIVTGSNGSQMAFTACGDGGSIAGIHAIDQTYSPYVLEEIWLTQNVGGATPNTWGGKMAISNYAIKTDLKNLKNSDLYVTRYRATARHDISNAVYVTFDDLLTAAITQFQLSTPYSNGIFMNSQIGATPYMHRQLVVNFNIKRMSSHHLLGGQQVSFMNARKKMKIFDRNRWAMAATGHSEIMMAKGDSVDFFVCRGGIVTNVVSGGLSAPTALEPSQACVGLVCTVRVDYRYILQNIPGGGASYTSIGVGGAFTGEIIPLMNPAAIVADVFA